MMEMTEPMEMPETIEPKKKRGRPPKSETNGLSPDIGFSESSEVKPRVNRSLERQISELNIGLTALFKAAGTVVGYFDQFDGQVISSDNLVTQLFIDSLCRAAKTDTKLRGWLLSLVHASAYSDIALYATMMIMPIVLHHFPNLTNRMFSTPYNDDSINTDN